MDIDDAIRCTNERPLELRVCVFGVLLANIIPAADGFAAERHKLEAKLPCIAIRRKISQRRGHWRQHP